MKNAKERAVLVTTIHKGVFFGYLKGPAGKTVKLRAARCCVHWSADLRGFMGLASQGPSSGCRIGPPANIEALHDVTSVLECTPEAVERWEKGAWA